MWGCRSLRNGSAPPSILTSSSRRLYDALKRSLIELMFE
jgi:hypothetical protein